MGLTKLEILLIIIIISTFGLFLILYLNKKNKDYEKPIKIKEPLIKKNMNEKSKIDIPVYYINLDISQDRRNFMNKQKKLFGIKDMYRVKAINGKNITREISEFETNPEYKIEDDLIFNNYTHQNLRTTEIAVTLSHLKAIRTAYLDNQEIALIIEDDTSFSLLNYWKKSLSELTRDFPENWECVSLFNQACYIEDNLPEYINIKDKICWGAVAYIINRKGMKNILSGMENMLILDKNDQLNDNKLQDHPALADVFIFNRIPNCYQRKIPLFYPKNEEHNLNSTLHPHHTWRHNIIANEIIKLYSK